MDRPQLVLDYAAPKSRGKVRLPSKSTIRVTPAVPPDRGVEILERLEGKSEAIFAIVFAVFVLFVLVGTTLPIARRMIRRGHPTDFAVVVPTLLATAEITTMLGVVNNTWRKTVVRAREGELGIRMTSLFKQSAFEYAAADIIDIMVTYDPKTEDTRQATLGEMTIRFVNGEARLFQGHGALEITQLVELLRETINPPAPLPPQNALETSPDSDPGRGRHESR